MQFDKSQAIPVAMSIFQETIGDNLAQSYWSMYNSTIGVILGMAIRANPEDEFDMEDRRKTMEMLVNVEHMLKYIRQEINATDQEMNSIERPGFMPPI